jgi:predicted lipoprotein with Yx(FWY)xxD motif
MRRTVITTLACAGLAAAGCGSAAATTAPMKSSRGAAVGVKSSRFGPVLFDGRGRSLYLFTRERTARSRCYGACAKAWPPLLTKSAPRALTGAKARLLGTTRRRGGALQVTYAGHPLYHYVGDTKAGQILCQGVTEFGGTWWVVKPNGAAQT